ncbi:MAG: ribose 5-phosphate isomerase [Subtercola sp.]|nr:ribose 5-phosphate isomerase [Subtercola sp.]
MASQPLRIIVGADDAGEALKNAVKEFFENDPRVAEVVDVTDVVGLGAAYPNVAFEAATRVIAGEADRALLVCGTGLGVAISANKVKGIRAVTAHDPYSIERSVKSNNAQILCFGGRVIAPQLAVNLASAWLDHEWDPNTPSAAKVDTICAYEEQ